MSWLNVIVSLLVSALVGGWVLLLGGPAWAAGGFAACVYLSQVYIPMLRKAAKR